MIQTSREPFKLLYTNVDQSPFFGEANMEYKFLFDSTLQMKKGENLVLYSLIEA